MQLLKQVYFTNEYENFVWQTSTGEQLRPSEMANSHLLLAVKQIWNANCKCRSDWLPVSLNMTLKHWSPRYTEAAVVAICLELRKRWNSLTPEQCGDVFEIVGRSKVVWKNAAIAYASA